MLKISLIFVIYESDLFSDCPHYLGLSAHLDYQPSVLYCESGNPKQFSDGNPKHYHDGVPVYGGSVAMVT